jgi:hypothetical protein
MIQRRERHRHIFERLSAGVFEPVDRTGGEAGHMACGEETSFTIFEQ